MVLSCLSVVQVFQLSPSSSSSHSHSSHGTGHDHCCHWNPHPISAGLVWLLKYKPICFWFCKTVVFGIKPWNSQFWFPSSFSLSFYLSICPFFFLPQPLVKANFCTAVSLSDLLAVRQCKADIQQPTDSSKDDFTKFVASLALSVPVKASLHDLADSEKVAIQVRKRNWFSNWLKKQGNSGQTGPPVFSLFYI